MKNWISFPRVEGLASRQAHADLPPGTYEREMGKEGFFGPSTQLYHAHPPTGWTSWEGPLRPRGDPARLRVPDQTRRAASRLQTELRQLRRLARPRRATHDDDRMSRQRLQNLGPMRRDRQRRVVLESQSGSGV